MALILLYWQTRLYHCTIDCTFRAVRYNLKSFLVNKYSPHWEIFQIKLIYFNRCCLSAFDLEQILRPSFCSKYLYNIVQVTQLFLFSLTELRSPCCYFVPIRSKHSPQHPRPCRSCSTPPLATTVRHPVFTSPC